MKKYLPFLVAGVWTMGLLIGLLIHPQIPQEQAPIEPRAWSPDFPCKRIIYLDGHGEVSGCDFTH